MVRAVCPPSPSGVYDRITTMRLIPEEASLVRDREAAALRSLPWQELVDRYRHRKEERRRVTEGGKTFELEVIGELDYEDDPTSDLYIFLAVRPVWLAPIPVLRWFMSARTTLVLDEDGNDWSLGDPPED